MGHGIWPSPSDARTLTRSVSGHMRKKCANPFARDTPMICSLPAARFQHAVSATNDLGEATEGAEFVLSVMPSHHARRVYQQMKPYLTPE